MEMFLKLIILILWLFKSLGFIYLFQIKEYRFDRFRALIKDDGIFNTFCFRPWRLPAKTPRNFLLVFFSLVAIIVFLFLIEPLNIFSFLIFLITTPAFVFLFVSLGILITSLPVSIYRQRIIEKAKNKIKNSKTVFIGITGSYGKTSTKEFLYQLLSQKYKVSKTEENINTDIGIALSVLKNLRKDTEFFIVEMGAYKIGEIANECKIVSPTFGILTGLGNQHLDLFGSKQNLIAAKKELLKALPKNGRLYINRDIKEFNQLVSNIICSCCFFSTNQKANIYVSDFKLTPLETKAAIIYKNRSFPIKTKIIGRHQLANLLPTIALSLDLGLEEAQIITAINNLQPIKNRLTLQAGLNNSKVLNDSYNSSVEGFIAAIETTNSFLQKKKLIVSRGVIELGKEKESSYRLILEKLKQSTLILLTTDKLFKKLDLADKVIYFNNEKAILDYLINYADKNTLIILEGKFPENFVSQIISN